MQEIDAVKIWRLGTEHDLYAEVVVEVLKTKLYPDAPDEWIELGRERIHTNFSTTWSLPQ